MERRREIIDMREREGEGKKERGCCCDCTQALQSKGEEAESRAAKSYSKMRLPGRSKASWKSWIDKSRRKRDGERKARQAGKQEKEKNRQSQRNQQNGREAFSMPFPISKQSAAGRQRNRRHSKVYAAIA